MKTYTTTTLRSRQLKVERSDRHIENVQVQAPMTALPPADPCNPTTAGYLPALPKNFQS